METKLGLSLPASSRLHETGYTRVAQRRTMNKTMRAHTQRKITFRKTDKLWTKNVEQNEISFTPFIQQIPVQSINSCSTVCVSFSI